MKLTEIIITNILPTGTAFAARMDDLNAGVFIPSRHTTGLGLTTGRRLWAVVVPNITHIDKTPWIAISIPEEPRAGDQLRAMILEDLSLGRATDKEVAESIGVATAIVRKKLHEMADAEEIERAECFGLLEGEDE